ncbi:acetate--CoA ligase family protein [Ruegeria sp. 2205SS24-7]|uniref:acetate--CoA ligase family protein n=1 Tax=Ruegeria discodermiae TaxID=3064389 RepID=UPI002740D1BA|nr:acetate--CoA ligase family protein [Ruegeria sp. 2205SS24-7]MDP5220429.1 acetate--CoA ligase family protein [Ruegeria sp. 2205SS24-7]
MARDLSRLLNPSSIAVIGGGAWCASIIEAARQIGFEGAIFPVHPAGKEIAGLPSYRRIEDCPGPIDSAFVGVNRHATIDVVRTLSAGDAGGAICFASGFTEAMAQDQSGSDLQSALVAAAAGMPILGPNCYGFVNALDRVAIWPDQHGMQPVEQGVAILTQSSNIAINLTMQKRGLPLAYMVTAGNQAQTGLAEIATALLQDDRVTALGLHIEGFGDLRAFEAMAARAEELGKPVVALKVGKSAQARAATVSHTASLAGGDAGAQALLARLGIPRLNSLPAFLETLKLLHVTGWLPSNTIATISCSGGEASLAADSALGRDLVFPSLNDRQRSDLRAALGPMVALANPLDYHTYVWRDVPAMTAAFAAMLDPSLAMTLLIVDFPRDDRCSARDWDCAIEAVIGAQGRTGLPIAMVATLPELMPEEVAERLRAHGIVAFHGLDEALAACEAASRPRPTPPAPLLLPGATRDAVLIPEADAKQRLAQHGLRVPRSERCVDAAAAAQAAGRIGFPVVLKGEGLAHKTEAGAVALNLATPDAVAGAANNMPADRFLVEEMITGGVAELLVGVLHDPAHGIVLTLAAGGILTELLQDRASLLLPASDGMIVTALDSLRIGRVLAGYRGQMGADKQALIRAIRTICDYVDLHKDDLEEIEVNPLICTSDDAVAADLLLRQKE